MRRAWRWAMLVVMGALLAPPAHSQDLIDLYRAALAQREAEALVRAQGALPVQPPLALPTVGDSLDLWRARLEYTPPVVEPEPPRFVAARWQPVLRLQRTWFRERFADVAWAFLGDSGGRSAIDTTWTYELRARLQARFGAPTLTVSELDHTEPLEPDAYIQFEYWFVVNDTLPLMVGDVGGPFDRGLVIATDGRFREVLPDVWLAVEEVLEAVGQPAPFADYYFDPWQSAWYRVGYDGRVYSWTPIPRPRLLHVRPHPEEL